MTRSVVRRWRAVTIGYQGWGNVGDEAILTGIEAVLAGSSVDVRTVIAGPQRVPAWPQARRIRMPRWLPSMELLRVFMRSDLLIIAGGGLVNDYWPTLIPRYLVITGMARALGCRVAWIGVGVRPLQHPGSRWLACRLVAISSTFAVRDSGSAALIRKSSKSSRITELTDPAWFNEPPEPSVAPSGMGIIIREPAPGDDDRASSVYDALAALISRRLASGQRTA